ncbi:hypothetical protein TBLA_0I02840 [Henningerozyma blattae CBS 6284]|uniref:Transcription factor MBP1 n=1 Tax=Henningerozyma blattae (strain ATCC 34711 / CBS 6284 / DSM 70876 / NBRC 10599 / NRRL Y-10934 / UCD 77-7) TaxID=1071380 RepID=I2H988_HENB6|nr:hypothetical protein TBLA_0I02840 [Tetrapisispora blattae CBS 6284]CCH62940.1 hypothetical protein TBLA_0I02840 [Tetrapisispora blattae CBS 6284]
MSEQIYSAKYSGVPVYEFIHPTGSIMKRKIDGWVNATHILKAAKFPKAKRTRILEKEVIHEIHEKVQGGFGKYQGTWVPTDIATRLSKKFGVFEEIQPLLDFVQISGDASPPPAPKHHHASRSESAKKKAAKNASTSALWNTQRSNSELTPVGSNDPSNFNNNSNSTDSSSNNNKDSVPTVHRKRGRPPASTSNGPNSVSGTRNKRKLTASLKRSQSDVTYAKSPSQNTSTISNHLPSHLPTLGGPKLSGLDEKPYFHQDARFKEVDINDGLSSDVEQINSHAYDDPFPIRGQSTYSTTNENDMQNAHRVLDNDNDVHVQQQHINNGSVSVPPLNANDANKFAFSPSHKNSMINGTQYDNVSSTHSSPSLPTSPPPGNFLQATPTTPRFQNNLGTSPVASMIPRFPANTKQDVSDIDDQVNKYLTKLVNYFTSNEIRSNKSVPEELLLPPVNSAPYIDAPIDPELHTAFHWSCAMGILPIAEALFNVGTNTRALNSQGQTPLMRSVMFHNCYTRRAFPRIFQLLHETIFDTDSNLQTILFHIVRRKSSTPSAVYYLSVVLSKIKDVFPQYRIDQFLDAQDKDGNTVLHVAANNGDEVFYNTLMKYGTSDMIENKLGQTAANFMVENFPEKIADQDLDSKRIHDSISATPLQSTNDFLVYPSDAATLLSKSIPLIVTSLKQLAEEYNGEYKEKQRLIKDLEKNLKSSNISVQAIQTKICDICNVSNVDDIDNFIQLEEAKVEDLDNKVKELKEDYRDKLEGRQKEEINNIILNEHIDNFRDEDKLINEDEKSLLQQELDVLVKKQKELIDKIVDNTTDHVKVQKYRKMISQGTDMAIEEVDGCLDIILETLRNEREA